MIDPIAPKLESLNFNHLFYFWVAAKEGSIAKASKQLLLTPQTVSAQIKSLEATLGEELFSREGREVELTEVGREAFRYASDMFRAGSDLLKAIQGKPDDRPPRILVGAVTTMPRLVAVKLLKPVFDAMEPVQYAFVESDLSALIGQLGEHRLDLVLSDSPIPVTSKIRAYNHELGSCGVVFMAEEKLAQRYRRGFPRSLSEAPVLLPALDTPLRRHLDPWLQAHGVQPHLVGEFQDRASLHAFARAGGVVFPAPQALENDLRRQSGLRRVGRVRTVRETYYAISMEKRIKNPVVVRIRESARKGLFQKRLER